MLINTIKKQKVTGTVIITGNISEKTNPNSAHLPKTQDQNKSEDNKILK